LHFFCLRVELCISIEIKSRLTRWESPDYQLDALNSHTFSGYDGLNNFHGQVGWNVAE